MTTLSVLIDLGNQEIQYVQLWIFQFYSNFWLKYFTGIKIDIID